MPATLNVSLTDELRAFVDKNHGDGTLYATPSEFLRSLIREKKERQEAAELREGIIEGFQDIAAGRTMPYSGNLENDLKAYAALKDKV